MPESAAPDGGQKAAYPPFDGAAWCGWPDPHPPHPYAAYGGVDDTPMTYACSGEGAE